MQVLPSKIGLWQLSGACQFHNHRTTYAAVHTVEDRGAALDVFDAQPGSYTAQLKVVMDDVNRIEHRGALAIYDVGTLPDGRPYVVRELLDGVTLATRLAEGPLPTHEAIEILIDVCDVLIAAHEAGVVHRTLDLHHIVLVEHGVKLIDWGLSDELRKSQLPTDDGWEMPSAPSPAIDTYALGVVLHQALSPMPPRLRGLWLALMAENPAERPSIREIAKRLASCIEETPVLAAEVVRDGARPLLFKPRNALVAAACAAPMLYFFFGVKHETPKVAAQTIAKPVERTAAAPAPTPAPPPPPAVTPGVVEPVEAAPAPVVRPAPTRVKAKPGEVEAASKPDAASKPVDAEPKPVGVEPPAKPSEIDAELLHEYQRVGHELMALDPEVSRELLARFRTIQIDRAMATPESRAAASELLRELDAATTAD